MYIQGEDTVSQKKDPSTSMNNAFVKHGGDRNLRTINKYNPYNKAWEC